MRAIEDGIAYARELADRKVTILKTVAEQGKLDGPLRNRILVCRDKKELEEIYLPYKPKRRTRATLRAPAGIGSVGPFSQAAE